uniref:Uncharacterized protein n=1 Tax=Pithovirus LCPAC304 TaxID=2506594 RepID=A0A481ZBD4_9VIRU|nr:MAG: hypothetical protein LCPAC304_03240 [Pithovirus LCPAC304]
MDTLCNELQVAIYDQLPLIEKLKANTISKEFESARMYSITKDLRSHHSNVSTLQAIHILKGLCILRLNEAFVDFFSTHSLFSCVQEVDEVIDEWECPECFQGYALYLGFYYQNEALVKLLFERGVINLSEEKRKRAQLYAAGVSGNTNDPLVAELRSDLCEKSFLYSHYIEGLSHRKPHDILAQELLSEKVEFWVRIADPGSWVQGAESPVEYVKYEEDKEQVPFCVLHALGYKIYWLKIKEVAANYLMGKPDTKLLPEVCAIDWNSTGAHSYFGLDLFPHWTSVEHHHCKHL